MTTRTHTYIHAHWGSVKTEADRIYVTTPTRFLYAFSSLETATAGREPRPAYKILLFLETLKFCVSSQVTWDNAH